MYFECCFFSCCSYRSHT